MSQLANIEHLETDLWDAADRGTLRRIARAAGGGASHPPAAALRLREGDPARALRGKREQEVDIIAAMEGRLVPFEVKYRHQATGWSELKGMVEFCTARKVSLGYVITKEPDDFGVMERELTTGQPLQVVKIPAPLACYWLGKSEIDAQPAEPEVWQPSSQTALKSAHQIAVSTLPSG
jgi:hypothetical protein